MEKIYFIQGGLQTVRQAQERNNSSSTKKDVIIIESKMSNLPRSTGFGAVHNYTGIAWDTDLESLKRELKRWAYKSQPLPEIIVE